MIERHSQSLYFLAVLLLPFALGPSFAVAQEKVRRNVEVEWEAIEGATLYEIQVSSKDGGVKKPMRFKSPVAKWSATIKPGLYEMQIRSFDDRGVPGDWSPASELQVKLPSVIQDSPKAGDVISTKEEKSQEIKLRWQAISGAEKYRVAVHSKSSAWQIEKEVSETGFSVTVPVGEDLEWNVTALVGKGQMGEVNPTPVPFQLKGPPLAQPVLQKPLSKYVREIKWDESPNAKSYSYELSYRNPKTRKWQKLESKEGYTETALKLDIARPSGRYRLKVQAFGERRDPSKAVAMDFEAFGGFRDPASLETAMIRDSIVKPNSYYLIASYLVTELNYQGQNHDENVTCSFSAVGGTGRIGLGYQPPRSAWGGFGIVDLSGFVIHGQNFKFASAEGHITHKLEFGQGGLFLLGTGIFSKELPIVSGNPTDGFQGVGIVRSFGPHLGFTYWTPITERLGAQINARGYYSMFGSTESSGKTDATLSYQYGLLGSYRLTPTWMGFGGVAVRKDEVNYKSNTGVSGQANTIRIDGTYLNLLLEYSF